MRIFETYSSRDDDAARDTFTVELALTDLQVRFIDDASPRAYDLTFS